MDWKAQIRSALEPGIDDDVLEELTQHAAATYASARAEGCDAAQAEARVAVQIRAWAGDPAIHSRRPKRPAVIEPPPGSAPPFIAIAQDLRYAWRLLRRQPAYAALVVSTMALGIAATTVLGSVAYGVLLKPLPWPNGDRLVRVSESRQGHEPRVPGTISNAAYLAWREQHTTIDDIGGWRKTPSTLEVDGAEPVRLQTAAVTPSLFTVLGTRAWRGRLFAEDDGPSGGSNPPRNVVILSYGLWQERFGGRDDAIGRTLRLDGRTLTIVGIAPRGFFVPDRSTRAWTAWAVPGVLGPQGARRMVIFSAMARLPPGVSPAQASAEATARARGGPDPGLAAVAMFGGNGPAEVSAVPAIAMMTADVKPALLVLLAAVLLLLATATANVASLQLARAAARRRELAIRTAIGASRARLVRQTLVENMLLGLLGGAAGLAIALLAHRVLPALVPADFPRIDDLAFDVRVPLLAFAASIAAGIGCGLLPALHVAREPVAASLAEDGLAPVGGSLRTRTARTRALIMTGQIAIACVMLVGASLLTRSFVALLQADRGYDPRNLLTARLPLPSALSLAQRGAVLDGLMTRLSTLPGVRAAAFGNALPLLTSGGFRAFRMRPPANPAVEIDVNAMQRVVSPGYLAAIGSRLSEGRTFTAADTMTAPMVVMVNRSFAAKYLGTQPLGTFVPNLGMCRGDDDRWQVVGVVDDVRQGAPTDAPQAEIFMPYAQVNCAGAVPDPVIVLRTEGDPVAYATSLREIVRQHVPTTALDSVMTMDARVMTNLARPRLYAVVLGGFGLFAVLIAGVGLFGVLSYTVALRAREIGVRTALGAQVRDIVGLIVGQSLAIAGAGLSAGLVASYWLTGALNKFLYGVTPHDAVSFGAVAGVLLLVSILASIVPARRAARVDPVKVLRS